MVPLAGAAMGEQAARVDPERVLSERFQFSAREVEQARQGQPAVKVKTERDELTLIGAVRLPGKKERLADWLRSIEHFRTAAQLGTSRVVPTPPTAAAFAQVPVDASDIAELKQCGPEKCAIRLSAEALAQIQRDPSRAADVVRQMLLGYTNAYLKGGLTGIAEYDGPQARASFAADLQQLIRRATVLTDLDPQLVAFLDGFPAAALPGADQLFYWSAASVGSDTVLSVHHLVIHRPRAGEVWIADKNIYTTRYLDAGVMVIGLYDTPDGTGYYAVAGSRIKASRLGGVAATVLRRQVERSAADTVRTYLEWLRESLSLAQ